MEGGYKVTTAHVPATSPANMIITTQARKHWLYQGGAVCCHYTLLTWAQLTLSTGPSPRVTPARPGLTEEYQRSVSCHYRPLQALYTGVSCGSSQPCHGPRATDRPTAAKHKYMPSPETALGLVSLHEENTKANVFPPTVRPDPYSNQVKCVKFKQSRLWRASLNI